MLHDETRKLLIEAWNKTHNAKEIAECFSVNTSTVYRLEKQMRETGSVKTRTSQRGRKHALTPEDLQNIDRVVQQEPDITIDEIINNLHASEQERSRCQGKTQKLEKTYVGERHKSSGLSGRKRSKHQYDATLCQSMWSKLKAFLRKEKIRIASELPSAISKGFLTIRPKDCIGWFHSCNYVQ